MLLLSLLAFKALFWHVYFLVQLFLFSNNVILDYTIVSQCKYVPCKNIYIHICILVHGMDFKEKYIVHKNTIPLRHLKNNQWTLSSH